jgi:hypothetical protein
MSALRIRGGWVHSTETKNAAWFRERLPGFRTDGRHARGLETYRL